MRSWGFYSALVALPLLAVTALVQPTTTHAAVTTGTAANDETGEEFDRKVSQLIEQLGDPQFAIRDRAREELSKLGFTAFDALTDAENHRDIEIAAQARYLLRQIRIDWTRDDDPPQVKTILKDYEFQNEAARLQKMEQLAKLPANEGIEWLCRLARFEQSPVLSKQAALLMIKDQAEPDSAAWPARAEIIRRGLGRSSRPAAKWLKALVLSRSNPEAGLAEWIKLAEAEQRSLEQEPSTSGSQFVMALLRKQVDVLDALGRKDDVLAALRKMVQAERGDPQTLSELVEWLAKRQAWIVIDEVATRFASNFDGDGDLLYTLAQARLAQGNEALADETADKALKLNPERPIEHLKIAYHLQERGLFKWSEREYRTLIEAGPPANDVVLRARFLLSENLHDQQRDEEAGIVLKGAVEAMDGDASVMRIVQRLQRSPEAIRSRMFYFTAMHFKQAGEMKKHAELLDQAIGQDSTDADVLIALYRLPGRTAEQRKDVLDKIQAAVKECRGLIEEAPEDATAYNQLAWLVGNTEGDIEEAVRLSKKSIEVKRDECAKAGTPCNVGGYLDTLAHCYYGLGDYENAVRYQTEATKDEPHSQAITRQLEVFRAALERQKAKGK